MSGVENGTKRFDELPFETGDIVVDRDDASPNEAVVVYQETLDRVYPNYAGGYPIPIERLHADAVSYYSFPSQRLQTVGVRDPPEIPLSKIDPAPYHARNVSESANRTYIETIRKRGRPEQLPLIRDCGGRFEVINGHKRIWARCHLSSYSESEQSVASRRLRSELGDEAEEILNGSNES